MQPKAVAFRQGDQLSSFEIYQTTFAIPIKRKVQDAGAYCMDRTDPAFGLSPFLMHDSAVVSDALKWC